MRPRAACAPDEANGLRDAALAGVQAREDVASLVELTAVAWRVADRLEELGDL
jgi:hypothetical protein